MRMPNGFGSVIKLGGNRRKPFQARVTIGFTDDGKQIFQYLGTFVKKEEALLALTEYNKDPYNIETQGITFEEVFEKWSKEHFPRVSNSSIERYSNAFNNYCKSLHKMRFSDIRYAHLQNVIDTSNRAHPTRASIKTLFNVMFKFAIKNDIVDKNYAEYVDVGQKEGKINRTPFTQKEIDKLFKYEKQLDFIDTILIMIYTGLRVSELLDIKTENVFLTERYMIGGLKTKAGKNRIIPINKKIAPFIEKYYNPQNEYLITNFKDEQMKYSNYRREKFDNLMEKLEMTHRPHDCRHTFASLMNSAEANTLCIKRIMGHSSQDITEDVYTHKRIDELIKAIDLI